MSDQAAAQNGVIEGPIFIRRWGFLFMLIRRWMLSIATLCFASFVDWNAVALLIVATAVCLDIIVTPRAADLCLDNQTMMNHARHDVTTGGALILLPRRAALIASLNAIASGGAIAMVLTPLMLPYADANIFTVLRGAAWGLALGGCAAVSWFGADILITRSRPPPVARADGPVPVAGEGWLFFVLIPRPVRDFVMISFATMVALAMAQLVNFTIRPWGVTGPPGEAVFMSFLSAAIAVGAWCAIWWFVWNSRLARKIEEPSADPPVGIAGWIGLGFLGFALACVAFIWIFYT